MILAEHRVVGMKNAFCEEVQAVLALALLKNEKDVTVMMFSEDKNKLKPVDLKADTTYEKALEVFDKEAVRFELLIFHKFLERFKIIPCKP